MRLVVTDTGPLHYLVLTGDIGLLPRLFERVLAPASVRHELADERAPREVRDWIAAPPQWLLVRPIEKAALAADDLATLGTGERDVILLASEARADLLLMDDRLGIGKARQRGFATVGTLGLLDLAARNGLVELPAAFARLKATSFYYRQGLLDKMLASHRETKR